MEKFTKTIPAHKDELNSPKPLFRKGWLRALFSVFIFFILQIIFYGLSAYFIPSKIALDIKNLHLFNTFILTLTFGISTLMTVILSRKFIDRKSFHSLGFAKKSILINLFRGFILAFIIYALALSILLLLDYFDGKFKSHFSFFDLLLSILIFIIVAFNEELYVRGYILQNLMFSFSRYFSLIISAVFFMFLHISNPNVNLLGSINIFLAGILLGLTYIYTRQLWFPISLHFFWNFIQGPILGFNVSGTDNMSLLFKPSINDNLISGGEFGFEGSILCTILLVITIIPIIIYKEKKLKKISEKQTKN